MKNQIIKGLLNGATLVTLLAAVTQTANAMPGSLPEPDAASTSILVGAVFTGLVVARKFIRR